MNVKPGHFKLKTLTEEQIYKELTTIDPKKATGLNSVLNIMVTQSIVLIR